MYFYYDHDNSSTAVQWQEHILKSLIDQLRIEDEALLSVADAEFIRQTWEVKNSMYFGLLHWTDALRTYKETRGHGKLRLSW